MDSSSIVLAGFIASACASVGTALGSLGVFFIQSLSRRLEDGLLSLAAGIMLAATFFSLLLHLSLLLFAWHYAFQILVYMYF